MPSVLTGPTHPPKAGGLPDRLVVLLHGYGADGADLINLAHVFAPHLPHAEFVAPNAPMRSGLGMGYQWFPISNLDPAAMKEGVRAAAAVLDDFIADALEERNLGPDRLALVGFSQGTVMALDRALRRADSARTIVGFSGMIADPACRLDASAKRPPVLLIHGMQDPLIPFSRLAETKTALAAAGFPVETEARPGLAHGIDHEGAVRAARFLADTLAGP